MEQIKEPGNRWRWPGATKLWLALLVALILLVGLASWQAPDPADEPQLIGQEHVSFISPGEILQEQPDGRSPDRRRQMLSKSRRRRLAHNNERMRFVLMCQVLDGEPPVQIKWFKDNQELGADLAGAPIELLASDELGASLLFRRVQQQHSGNYTCLATNRHGSTSFSSSMSVKVAPKWRLEPQDQESMTGEQITIDCQASGNPNPFIRWKFAALGQLSPSGPELAAFKLINSNHHVQTLENGSLAIRQASKDHEGHYLCEADNGVEPNLVKPLRLLVHQQAQIADELQVQGDSAPVSGPAAIPTATRSLRLAAANGSSAPVRLLCQPAGEWPLTVDWLKDGQLIYTHTMDAASPPSSLSAALETGQQSTARYSVSTRRATTAGPPRPVLTQVGALESELLIAQLRRSDAGMFACQARNAFGQAERKVRLLLQEPPEAPEVVDVAHIGTNNIGLRWLAPFDGNSPILKYIVEYRRHLDNQPDGDAPSGQSEKVMPLAKPGEQSAAGQQVQHTVHELQAMTRYSMRVVAVNALGRGRASVALSLRTEEEVPTVVPSHVEALVLSSKAIKLHWTISYPPERELIDGFFVGYRSFSGDPKKAEQPTFTYKTIRLTNQPAGQVSAEQPADQSALLSPLSSVAKQVPAQQAPSFGGLQQPSQLVQVSTFEFVIGALERNTEYTILIQCFNKKGAGPTSEPVVFKTFAIDPPDKLLLNADELTESSIRVSWRFPSASSFAAAKTLGEPSLVDGYVLSFAKVVNSNAARQQRPTEFERELSYQNRTADSAARISQAPPAPAPAKPSLGVDQWQAIQLAAQQRSHLLKNLECGTAYALKVWAFNKIGKGEPSDQIVVSTRGKAPVAPDRRSFVSVNSTQVRLHLGAWYDGGCEIDKFIVQYRARGQSDWMLVSNNILREQLSIVIRDLLPATAYELLVTAVNQVGPTEVRYKLMTLDHDGKQVQQPGSFMGSLNEALDFDSPDYDDDSTRREAWPDQRQRGSVLMSQLRQLLNSPLAMVLSLCFFLFLLLFLLLVHRFNGPAGSATSGATDRSNETLNSGSPRKSNRTNEPAPLDDSSAADSPQIEPLQRQMAAHLLHQAGQSAAECQYQPYYGQRPDYQESSQAECNTYVPTYGYHAPQTSTYAGVQRPTSLGQSAPEQQQCNFMQMLMMNGQQQPVDSYANALTTMARGGAKQPANNFLVSQAPTYAATLGRRQQINYGLPGKQLLLGQQPSDTFTLMGQGNTTLTDQNKQRPSARTDEIYPLSTFRSAEPQHLETGQPLLGQYADSSSSSSGRGTSIANSANLDSNLHERNTDDGGTDQKACDKTMAASRSGTQYDVPFRFNSQNIKPTAADLSATQGAKICY